MREKEKEDRVDVRVLNEIEVVILRAVHSTGHCFTKVKHDIMQILSLIYITSIYTYFTY